MCEALAIEVGEAGAKEATSHATNSAFLRYCQARELTTLRMAKVVQGMHSEVKNGKRTRRAIS